MMMSFRQLKTTRGYDMYEVVSALQKEIRRGNARLAGYWAIELFESDYVEYLWRRLLTISAEDVWGVITYEVEALYRSWKVIHAKKKGGGRVFASKATILLALARKSRDADHLTNLVYDERLADDAALEASLREAREAREEIPDYALCHHTRRGKLSGTKNREQFIRDEHAALKPFQPGLFDDDVTDRRPR